jgi:hypothetical protein
MAKLKCAISGLTIAVQHVPIVCQESIGYYHPIFAVPRKHLYGLYSKHCSEHLTPTDSYLLFLALLHSTDKVTWTVPVTRDPTSASTATLIANNIAQLIAVIEETDCISHPSFSQPALVVSTTNSSLRDINAYIVSWKNNISRFRSGYKEAELENRLQKLENKLSHCILSGLSEERYIHVIANWAAKAAEFPREKEDSYKKIIRTCFNSDKMFSTPLSELKEVKSYCEASIEPGSIHFHKLMEVLREGITRHTNYLGMAPEVLGYKLIPVDTTKQELAVEIIKTNAPTSPPVRESYSDTMSFIRAKLAFAVATASSLEELVGKTKDEEL